MVCRSGPNFINFQRSYNFLVVLPTSLKAVLFSPSVSPAFDRDVRLYAASSYATK
ncbi:hypothetical protein Plhal304r1_c001g0001381 [Plasmopara halstedii]